MKKIMLNMAILLTMAISVQLNAHCSDSLTNGQDVWRSLKRGNREFIRNSTYAKERRQLANGQNPPCVVLSCSDSRVPPEIIFDQGLGRLFVARVAGNIVDNVVVDSIEFAVNTWDVSLIVVLGHTGCGAVEGAVERLRINGGVIDPEIGHLNAVLIPIERAILAAGINFYASDAVEKATRANILYSANRLLIESPSIAEAVQSGRVRIIGAEYHLRSGKVKQLFII